MKSFCLFLFIFSVNVATIKSDDVPADVRVPPIQTLNIVINNYNNCTNPGTSHKSEINDTEILQLLGSREDKWYLIKHAFSDLVAEVTSSNESIVQTFSGKPEQLWKFEPADKPGLYYIVNKKSGKVMQSKQDTVVLNMNEKSGFLNQKWALNHDGRIVNAGTKHILDIAGGKYVPGNPLIALEGFNGNPANVFDLQEHLK